MVISQYCSDNDLLHAGLCVMEQYPQSHNSSKYGLSCEDSCERSGQGQSHKHGRFLSLPSNVRTRQNSSGDNSVLELWLIDSVDINNHKENNGETEHSFY